MQYNQYPGGQGQPPSGYNQYNGPDQNNQPAKTGRVALRWGLIFGVILAVVDDGIYLINSLISAHSLSTTTTSSVASTALGVSLGLSCLIFLIGLAAYFVAGILASRQTGLVRTGVFAGMWTGGVYGVVDLIVRLIVLFAITLPVEQALRTTSTSTATAQQFLVVGGIIEVVIAFLLAIGVGAGMGALGGLIGRSNARKRMPQQVYGEQMYQPYPGQPVPPMNPMNPMNPVNPMNGPFQPSSGGPYPSYPQAPFNAPFSNPGQPVARPMYPAQADYATQAYVQPPQTPQVPETPRAAQSFGQTPVADSGAGSQNENQVGMDVDATRPTSQSQPADEEPTVRADSSNYPRYPEQ